MTVMNSRNESDKMETTASTALAEKAERKLAELDSPEANARRRELLDRIEGKVGRMDRFDRLRELTDGLNADDDVSRLKIAALVHELEVYQTEIEIQNEELITAQVETAEARDRYHELFDLAPVGFCVLNKTGAVEEGNDHAKRILDPVYRRLEGKPLGMFLTTESRKTLFHAMERAQHGCEEGERYELKAGAVARICIRWRDDGDKKAGYLVSIADVTDERRDEENKERRFQTLLRNFPNGMVLTFDLRLRYTVADGRDSTRLPFPKDNLIGKTPREALGDEVADALEPHYQAALEGEERRFETEFNGETYEVRVTPIRERDDAVVGGMVVSQLITDRKLAERRVLESERLNRALVQANLESLVLVNRMGDILAVNEVGAERLGYEPDDLVGKNVYNLLPPRLAKSRKRRIERAFETGEKDRFEDEREGRFFANYMHPIADEDGVCRKMAILAVDVTESRKRERALNRYKNRLEELVRKRTAQLERNGAQLREEVEQRRRAERDLSIKERQYRQLVENIPNGGVYLFDEDMRYVAVGGKGLDALPDELEGKTVSDVLDASIAEEVEENYRAAIDGETRSFEVELLGRMYEVFVAPVETDGEKRMGMALTQDVTEWESTLARLRLSEARLRQAQRLANLGVYQFGADGEGLFWSPEAYRIVGLRESENPPSREDFLAMTLTEDRETVERALSDAATLKRRSRFEFRAKRPDGSIAYAQSVAEPALDEDGNLLRVFGAMHDITGQKQTQEEIAQLNRDLGRRAEALETANRELEAFSYSVSHDLRSPLRALNGFSVALTEDYRDELDDEGKDMLDRIAAAANKMSDLIDDLLKLSRISRTELVVEAVNLSAIAESIVEEARQKEPERDLRVDVERDLYVNADARLVRVALANLLGNALKFTRGKEDACVCVGRESAGDRVEFFVKDNGAGFDQQYAGKLFRPFQRLHSTKEFEGTGIGLATVKRVVQKHGGDIRAVGEPGAGAAFYFTLPRGECD